VTAPWILAGLYLAVVVLGRFRPHVLTNVPFALIVTGATWFGAAMWARAAEGFWPQWAYVTTWGIWFVIGVGGIVWVAVAMNRSKDGHVPPAPPGKKVEPPMGDQNYVAPTVYGSRARAKYEYKGKRARR
jgi:hypothetical protein